ncbi:MAG TPA: hypothetical protein VHP11_07385, partial [Tepidisphaeraceae bacterium]|nr:hypothetical protein [Tepidisphaeraceae bacterium]
DAIARCLFERMSDGTLFYHTPLHVLSMLGFAQDHGIALEPWQQLCIWFHDAIYVPSAKAGENEHCSALFMHALLQSHLPADVLSQAEAGIEATALYHSPDVDPAFHVILDLDLCNFAWDREGYRAASDDVAREMIPVHGKEKYPLGRKKFLTDMLARQSIYRTEVFRANFEALARANVEQGLLESL